MIMCAYQDAGAAWADNRDEHSTREPACGFDFDEVDRRLLGKEVAAAADEEGLTEEQWAAFGRAMATLTDFLVPNPKFFNRDGVAIRAVLVAWLVRRELQPLTLTELAHAYGYKAKQSFGREVELLKRHLPGLVNSHMKKR